MFGEDLPSSGGFDEVTWYWLVLLGWVKTLSWIVVIHYTDSLSSPDARVTTIVSLPYG